MGDGRLKRLAFWVPLALLLALAIAWAIPPARSWLIATYGPGTSREVTAEAVLESVRRQRRLVVFSARLLADIDASYARTLGGYEVPGTRSTRTLIVPGTVSYALDLERLTRADLSYDAGTRTLTVRRPPVEPMDAAADLARVRIFDARGLLAGLTDADEELERLALGRINQALLDQARDRDLMALADDAADTMLAATFQLPLAAAGMADAKVVVVRPASGTALAAP